MWMEVVVTKSRHYPDISRGGTVEKIKKTSVTTAGVPPETRTEHFPNALLELCFCTDFLGRALANGEVVRVAFPVHCYPIIFGLISDIT
jgi:hypothetical protein